MVVLKIHDLISSFEEFQMRVSVLRTNPYVKNFFDKMIEVEKWWKFSGNGSTFRGSGFNKIFKKLADTLTKRGKRFANIDLFFRTVSKSFELTPQVYKAC